MFNYTAKNLQIKQLTISNQNKLQTAPAPCSPRTFAPLLLALQLAEQALGGALPVVHRHLAWEVDQGQAAFVSACSSMVPHCGMPLVGQGSIWGWVLGQAATKRVCHGSTAGLV